MKARELFFVVGLFFLITCGFFFKTLSLGHVPFPGDLLVSEYNPWKTESYNGYGAGGVPNKAQYFDTIRQIYPWRTLSTDLLKQGQIPLWNPYNFSGSPLLANVQSAVFYPLTIFYLFLPQVIAWSLLVFLQPFLSGIFTYLFCRKIGMSSVAAFFSAVSFSFSLFLSVFLEYNTIGQVVMWLPLALFFFERFLDGKNRLDGPLMTLSCGLLFLAGHLQVAGLCLGFILVYGLLRILFTKQTVLKTMHFLLLIILGIGIAGIQLLPTFELSSLSARTAHDRSFLLNQLLLQPYQLIMFFAPDIYGNPAYRNYILDASYPTKAVFIGIIPLFFVLVTVLSRQKNIVIKCFLSLAVASLLLLLRSPLTELLYTLPVLNGSSPSNGIFLLSFCLSILGGFGFMTFQKEKTKIFKYVLIFLGIFFVTFSFAYFVGPKMQLKSLAIPGGIFVIGCITYLFTKAIKKEMGLPILLIALVAFDLFYYFQKFNPFVPANLVFPESAVFSWLQQNAGSNRFVGYGSGSVDANVQTQYKIYSANGYDPLYPRQYGEWVQAAKDGKLARTFINATRSDAVIAIDGTGYDVFIPETTQRMLNIGGVKYILTLGDHSFSETKYKKVYKKDNWMILENKEVLPRVFFAQETKQVSSKEPFEKTFFALDFTPATTVLLEKDISISGQKGEILSSNMSENMKSFNVAVRGSGLLFLSDTFYPGWRAFIDGQETPIIKANYTFQAVEVPAGKHSVVFHFLPSSFSWGTKLTIISLVLLSFSVFLFEKLKRYAR